MTGHGWLDGVLTAVMVIVAAFCAARIVISTMRGRGQDTGADGLHVLMGIAMAGMFDPRLSPIPGTAWQAVFAASAAWFGWLAIRRQVQDRGVGQGSRRAHPAPHAVESAAMVYMLLPSPPRPGGHGPVMTMPGITAAGSGARNPALALVLALFLLGYIVWTTDGLAARLPARSAPHQPPAPPAMASRDHAAKPPVAPRLAACTKIAMSAAMGYMLLMTL
jgi:hypothetical protein